MRKEGPLVLVEDDADDQELILLTLKELGIQNDIKVFKNGEEALDFLYQTATDPFLILSDINMPKMDGITFKRKIDQCEILKKKCIPFVFISTSPSPFIAQVCDLSIQGFFEKGNSLRQLNETLKIILTYWNMTKHLN
ncbi:response regulator [Chryseosolibacter indicus]|uniref:Response regulator n=1 Tax=Chryseosolibacter indicus TaxID=2782351 RepID=A0ABS5VSW0_9BACT|nr:response regulator [Chryseosolibacter indicus]MBT1704508.1 response regulator [Chryseosolibacter indicus]